MTLGDVQADLKPAVEALLATGLDYHRIKRAFQLVLVKVALEQNGCSPATVARRLRITRERIHQIAQDRDSGARRKWGKRGDHVRTQEMEAMEL